MKKIILKSLTFVNFKGEQSRTTEFNHDVTTISGDNGLGKSRHFDAFIWLLFGKDTEDRKDYEIKTLVNGGELHKVECSVTGVLDVDGEEITLKRALVEDWVKPRGQAEQKYKGTHTECWWNGTPVSVTEYGKRVAGIVEASLFKMITNPAFFPTMPWKLQREQLFQMAGTIDKDEIAAMKPEYAALLDKIGGKSFEDFKAEISARKKRLKDDLAEVQPRIDQTHKMKPEAVDFASIEAKIAAIDKEVAGIDESISSVAAMVRKTYEAQQEKQKRIDSLQSECQALLMDAKGKAQEEAYAANARKRELEASIRAKRKDIELAQKEIDSGKAKTERMQGDKAKLEAQRDALRAQWFEENGRVFQGETVCPHCGQELPNAMIADAQAIFNKDKADKCEEINRKGKEVTADITDMCRLMEEALAEQEKAIAGLNTATAELADLLKEFEPLEEVSVQEVVPEDIPGYASKKQEIESLKGSFEEVSAPDASAEQEKKKSLLEERAALSARLQDRDTIARCDKEIATLEDKARLLAQQIADIEKEEFIAQEFTRVRIDESEKRINAMFKEVSFRLFDYTIDGNPVETCVPLVKGVPYGSVNTAGRINAGLDIINTLCRFYGICAPIFIDQRESVNALLSTESQIINLVVTKDKQLIVK
ncbi:MAG: hypothetical protein NC324_02695 [Bacteroides sp.]|nr:hypothetical protein [Bacteroides sp.]